MSKNDDMTPEERQKYIDWGLDPDGPPGDWTGYIPEPNDMLVNHILNDALTAPVIDPQKSALMDVAPRTGCPAPGVHLADLLNEAWAQTREERQAAKESVAHGMRLDPYPREEIPPSGGSSETEKSRAPRTSAEGKVRSALEPIQSRVRQRMKSRDDGRER